MKKFVVVYSIQRRVEVEATDRQDAFNRVRFFNEGVEPVEPTNVLHAVFLKDSEELIEAPSKLARSPE